ncbi:MAG: hypothetical protein ACOC95_06650 [Planctomycetota bacterium]
MSTSVFVTNVANGVEEPLLMPTINWREERERRQSQDFSGQADVKRPDGVEEPLLMPTMDWGRKERRA